MKKDQLQKYSFLGILIGVAVLVFFIFKPFLMVFALASILAIVLYPLYEKFFVSFKSRAGLASSMVLIIIAICIIIPTILLGSQIFNQTQDIYSQLRENQSEYLLKLTTIIEKPIHTFNPTFTLDLQSYISAAASWFLENIRGLLSGTLTVVINIVLIVVTLYFLLKDGALLKSTLINISPFQVDHNEKIISAVQKTVRSVLLGTLLTALIQGFLAGIGFAFFGVPNAALWGSIAVITALIPSVGTAIVVFPAIAYLYFTSSIFATIGLLIWSVVVVGLVDNLLRPYFYSRGVEVHPLLVLFSVFGGLSLFGSSGFIFGPVILMLFYSLLSMYQEFEIKNVPVS
jgi:predicted PurR-regulated permease PerM